MTFNGRAHKLKKMGRSWIEFLKFIYGRRLVLLTFAFAFMLIGLFFEFTAELHEDEEQQVSKLDKYFLLFIAKMRVDTLNGAAVDLTALGSFTVLTVFTLLGLMTLIFHKNYRGALYLFCGASGSGILSSIMKNFFTRARPTEVEKLVEVTSYSYPSGHSLASSAFYLLVSFLLFNVFRRTKERVIIFLFFSLLIVLIGLSRIYLGVHYPSDVLGGLLLGSGWTFLLTAIFYGQKLNGSALDSSR